MGNNNVNEEVVFNFTTNADTGVNEEVLFKNTNDIYEVSLNHEIHGSYESNGVGGEVLAFVW